MPNCSRSRPLEPPSSLTPTIAVMCGVIRRKACKVAESPCPPPRATTSNARFGTGFIYSRPKSRCTTRTSTPFLTKRALKFSAIATLRCLPPVQPIAIVTNLLPSRK